MCEIAILSYFNNQLTKYYLSYQIFPGDVTCHCQYILYLHLYIFWKYSSILGVYIFKPLTITFLKL